MKASFSVEIDQTRSLLRLRLSGFFSLDDVRALAHARDAAVARFRCGPNQHVTLCDARGGMLSTKDVASEFERLLANPAYKSRRLAYVADGALTRFQAARVLGRKDIAFFEDPEAALAWLLDPSHDGAEPA